MKISIVLPIYNEEKNIRILYEQLLAAFRNIACEYEIIAVNDGSKDNSFSILKELAIQDRNFKAINFQFNFGQTAALSAGIKYATGEIILPMDSDLQNDPNDIQRFIDKLNEGYDVVSGWRKNRWQKNYIKRKIPSMTANWMIGLITGIKIHDYGCTMKAYKKEIIQGVQLYGEMHRFIPAYVAWHGGKVAEIIVNDRERIHGKTKYGLSRTFKVILDLLVFKFLSKYFNRPMHFFGGLGFISLAIGLVSGITAIILKIAEIRSFVDTPLPIFSALFIIVGVQLVVMGILAEMLMRVYYESQKKEPYIINEKYNF
jgi:glycosyltransferase involved in cell wall biosynthesis